VIATNYFDQIDSAVRRVGRIDSLVGVGWPDAEQRRRTIETELRASLKRRQIKLSKAVIDAAVEELVEQTRYFVRGELVASAGAVAERRSRITGANNTARIAQVKEIVRQVRSERGPSMAPEDRDQFRRDAAESSVTHVAGRGELRE
jgi:SpoVK/Ycf46/Vps4 family AAA+-type ATPase